MKTLIAVLGVAACSAFGQINSSTTTAQVPPADSARVLPGVAGGASAYYIDSGVRPWGMPDYDLAMDNVFGPGNWAAATYFDDPNAIFASAEFIYLEGSDSSASELTAWLGANTAALENWVTSGGNLYINAAPNEGGNIAFPFGVTCVYPAFSAEGHAVGPHPIFDGPFTPVATDYTGNSFGHATITGAPVTIMDNEFGSTVLAEGIATGGNVVYGGMTAPFWQDPQPDSQNLLQNIISYVSAGGGDIITPGDNFYYVDSGSPPWGQPDYANAMDAVFGGGNWTAATYADDAITVLEDAAFIYFEGSDSSADELNAWLGANTADLEEWVNNGGKVYINAAPNEGGNIALPFGATLTYPDFSAEGHAAGPHPIFSGPFTPVVTDYTGNSFGHATIGGGGTTVIENEFGTPVVTEGTVTNGAIMYGGMTAPFWQDPQPESQNLLQNILSYVAFGPTIVPGDNMYYLDNGTAPWSSTNYGDAMDAVFGGGNWTAATYADDATTILLDAGFLYLEGSDSSASELNAWLGVNGSSLESWVANGGNLYINAAPNEGGSISFPFGVVCNYPDTGFEAHALIAHPIFDGPFTPVTTDYTGSAFAHATVSNTGVGILENENGGIELGEGFIEGGGIIIYGGLTSPQFQNPQPDAQNLLQNIIAYVSGEADCFADCDGNGQLNILDFVCYQALFQSNDLAADCDGNGQLNILDFVCFQAAFQAGCP